MDVQVLASSLPLPQQLCVAPKHVHLRSSGAGIGRSRLVRCSNASTVQLPPAPASLPLIGHLHHFVGQIPHQLFQRLAQSYGPVLSLNLGSMPVVVVSDVEGAREVLKVQDSTFASRPKFIIVKNILCDCKDVVFGDYTKQLKETKKFLLTELLSSRKVDIFTEAKSSELAWMVQSLADASSSQKEFEVREHLVGFAYNVITRIIMGKRCYGVPAHEQALVDAGISFKTVISETMELGVAGSVVDFFPWLEFLDWKVAKSKELHSALDKFLQGVIEEHRTANKEQATDFLDIMLGAPCFENDDNRIKGLLFDIFIGGTDTSSTHLEWALAELIKHPGVLRKAQEEIRSVVGSSQKIEEEDIVKLPYLQAVVKEVFRLHPPVALLVPHYSNQDCVLRGYTIPAGTTVFVNIYAIGRDPKLWPDPLKFDPDRFLNREVDLLGHGQGFELIPFGSGRRSCPGSTLGLSTVHLALATLLHCFDWKTNPDVDFTEKYGATNLLLHPLKVRPVPRSEAQSYFADRSWQNAGR